MPTTKQIDAILPYLDRLTTREFSAGTWHGSAGELPQFEASKTVEELCQALYENDWVSSTFDWTKWQEHAREYVESPEKIESADVETIEFHGYHLAKSLGDAAGHRLLTAYGTLYRALGRLEAMGLLVSRWEDPAIPARENRPGRRLYTLTAAGSTAAVDARQLASASAPRRARRRDPEQRAAALKAQIKSILSHDYGRWLMFSVDRLWQFGYRFNTY